MVDTIKVTDASGRVVEVEVGADGENPVSPNNPPAKAGTYDRANPETPDSDESVGMDGERPVSPNNPPENTQTRSDDVYEGTAPEGVNEAVVEAAQAEQYPASYQPVKDDVEAAQNEQEPVSSEADKAPAQSASKGEWVDYAVKQGADRDEAEAATKDELIAAYGS